MNTKKLKEIITLLKESNVKSFKTAELSLEFNEFVQIASDKLPLIERKSPQEVSEDDLFYSASAIQPRTK